MTPQDTLKTFNIITFNKFMQHETSAGIIIYRKTLEGPRFLILYHGRDYWNFPKGGIEAGERTFQTALREIREETGIMRSELKFQEYFKVFEKFTFWRNNERVYKTITFYLAETRRKVVKISDEKTGQPQEGFAWFTYKEAVKVLGNHKDILKVLKQAYDFLEKRGVVRVPANKQRINFNGSQKTVGQSPHFKPKTSYGNQNGVQRKSL